MRTYPKDRSLRDACLRGTQLAVCLAGDKHGGRKDWMLLGALNVRSRGCAVLLVKT